MVKTKRNETCSLNANFQFYNFVIKIEDHLNNTVARVPVNLIWRLKFKNVTGTATF